MRRALVGCILLAILCAGCGSTRPGRETAVAVTAAAYDGRATATAVSMRNASIATAMVLHAPMIARLNDAEKQWQTSGVVNYRLRMRVYGHPTLHQNMSFSVINGQVVDFICSTPPPNPVCSIPVSKFLIPETFRFTEGALQDPNLQTMVEYDQTYGFIRRIAIKSLNSTGASEQEVEEFAILP